jgi:PAS domain S-box-containing protein
MADKRVLVVEDDTVVAMDLKQRLGTLGFEVVGLAHDERGAVELARRYRPDLALMDIRLGGNGDGIVAATEIRKSLGIPIVFLTAYAEESTLQRAKQAEPFGYILKPFEDRELRSSIELALYKHGKECEITRLTRLYAMLSQTNQAIVWSRSADEVIQKVARLAVEHGRYPCAWVGRRPSGEGPFVPFEFAGEGAAALSTGGPGESPVPGLARLIERAASEGMLCVAPDLTDPVAFGPVRPILEKQRIVCAAALPFLFEGRVCAVLNLFATELEAFDEPERKLLSEVSMDVSYALEKFDQEARRQRTEADLKAISLRQKALLAAVPEILTETDDRKRYVWMNRAGRDFFGEDAIGREAGHYFLGDQATYEAVAPLFEGKTSRVYVESLQCRVDGQARLLAWYCSPLRNEAGRVTGALSSARDITDQVAAQREKLVLEERLLESHKMEAVGRLAGGIAHDFNNLLTVVNGTADLARETLPAGHPARTDLETILDAGQQAAALTQKLLAFARRQMLIPRVFDLTAIVRGMEQMLKRMLGEGISLELVLPDLPLLAKVDRSQFEHVLVHLTSNAKHAMSGSGRFTISLAAEACPLAGGRQDPEWPAGGAIVVKVADTGCGMDETVRARVFEPFFSTKERGRGTGLGLASVHGTIVQSGGTIEVESTPGKGATFTIRLPQCSQQQAVASEAAASEISPPAPLRTLLLVEDDEPVRTMASRFLEKAGFRVFAARDGLHATQVCEGLADPLDLLVTDVVMPAESGPALARRLLGRFPGLKVLYISGHSDDEVFRHGVRTGAMNFLQKPFMAPVLIRKVREVLAAPRVD